MMTPARKEPDLTTYAGRFAARLRTLRLKAKLTPEQVAEALEIHPQTIYKWESTITAPSVETYPKIAMLYKVKYPRDILPKE